MRNRKVSLVVNKILEGADVRSTLSEFNVSFGGEDIGDIDPFKNNGRDRAKNVYSNGEDIKDEEDLKIYCKNLVNSISGNDIVNCDKNVVDLFCAVLSSGNDQLHAADHPATDGALRITLLCDYGDRDYVRLIANGNETKFDLYSGKSSKPNNLKFLTKADAKRALRGFVDASRTAAANWAKKNGTPVFDVRFTIKCGLSGMQDYWSFCEKSVLLQFSDGDF